MLCIVTRPWTKRLYQKLTQKRRKALHLSSLGMVIRVKNKFGKEKVCLSCLSSAIKHSQAILIESLASDQHQQQTFASSCIPPIRLPAQVWVPPAQGQSSLSTWLCQEDLQRAQCVQGIREFDLSETRLPRITRLIMSLQNAYVQESHKMHLRAAMAAALWHARITLQAVSFQSFA